MEQQIVKISAAEGKVLEAFTEMLIKQIEVFKGDWHKPWQTEGCLGAAVSNHGREYRGVNAFLLMMVCSCKGYKYPIFGTYNSWTEFSFKTTTKGNEKVKTRITDKDGNELPLIHVKEGEHGYPALFTFFKVFKKNGGKCDISFDDFTQLSEKEKEDYMTIPRQVTHCVFNIEQTNLEEVMPDLYKKLTHTETKERMTVVDNVYQFQEFDEMLSTNGWVCPIVTVKQDRAYYSPSKDQITLPLKEQFVNGESFYSTAMHEMAHSTGHSSRLNRDGITKPNIFGSSEYAREELVAEMTAALCCSRYGIKNGVQEESVAYLDNWLASLKKGPAFLKSVMDDVRKASDMIIEKVKTIS